MHKEERGYPSPMLHIIQWGPRDPRGDLAEVEGATRYIYVTTLTEKYIVFI